MDTLHSANKPIRRWLLWIPRALLLIYIFVPFFKTVFDYTFTKELSPRFWDFGSSIYSMIPILVLLLIAWFKPFIGGILILIACFIGLIVGFLSIAGNPYAVVWFIMWAVLLVPPGCLFIVFGRTRSKAENE